MHEIRLPIRRHHRTSYHRPSNEVSKARIFHVSKQAVVGPRLASLVYAEEEGTPILYQTVPFNVIASRSQSFSASSRVSLIYYHFARVQISRQYCHYARSLIKRVTDLLTGSPMFPITPSFPDTPASNHFIFHINSSQPSQTLLRSGAQFVSRTCSDCVLAPGMHLVGQLIWCLRDSNDPSSVETPKATVPTILRVWRLLADSTMTTEINGNIVGRVYTRKN